MNYKVVLKSDDVEYVENVMEVIYTEMQVRMFDQMDNLLFLASTEFIAYIKKEENK